MDEWKYKVGDQLRHSDGIFEVVGRCDGSGGRCYSIKFLNGSEIIEHVTLSNSLFMTATLIETVHCRWCYG